jgi:hypothetical protein
MSNQNQGEGDKVSANKYNSDVRSFIKEGKVDAAAKSAANFVDTQPLAAARAERQAKHGPTSWLQRTIENVRRVIGRK